jgi:SnoaL-like domain
MIGGMRTDLTAGGILREFWARIDAQDWAGLSDLLDPDLRVRYLHTGEEFRGAAAFVRLNREYPGRWHAALGDLVEQGSRAVSCVRVSDPAEEYHVASFATIRSGLIAELTEVWTSRDSAIPAGRRPQSPA